MKQLIQKVLRPSNRGVRVLVGLLLVGLLLIQVTQSVATLEDDAVLKQSDGDDAPDALKKLAETDHVALLRRCLERYDEQNIPGYTCTFIKQERIRGKLGLPQHIDVKFLAKPFSVAMAWTKNAPIGDRMLYVEGKYKDEQGQSRMIVRPSSEFLRTLTGGGVLRLPDGPDAMRSTLRPCTQFGFRNSIQSLLSIYELARQRDECYEQFGGMTEIDGRECLVLERFLPNRPDYPAKRTVVCVDVEYLLPVRVIGWDWNDELVCDYQYINVNFDVALRAEDFTPQANGINYNR